jgi:hypothetical protein
MSAIITVIIVIIDKNITILSCLLNLSINFAEGKSNMVNKEF